eukprot:symbB.v1.2.028684.t1/scaffold3057.1/size64513/2
MAPRADAREVLLETEVAGGATVMDASLVKILDFMYKVELFQKLDAEEILRLAKAFTHREVLDGERIVSQGEEGYELFFIEAGTVSVLAIEGSEEREITTLSQGDYFGETALVQKAPRNASVVAVGEVRLRVLSRDQFEEFDLHRKLQLEVRHTSMKNGLQELLGDLVTMRTFCKAMLLIGAYFLIAVLIFSNLEGWDGLDVIYFSIITLMTVGYGDFAPKHWGSRLTLVFFVMASLILVATSIGEFLETLVALEMRNERARKAGENTGDSALLLQQARVGVFDFTGQRKRWRRRTLACVLALLGPGSRTAVGFVVLFGVPLFGMMLARIVEIAYGRAKRIGLPAVVGGLTNEKFEQLIDFTDKLWRAGGYNSKPQESLREEITPFEFLCFILTQNESISLDEIKQIMGNFSELDVTKTGKLDQRTVDEWLRRGSCNPEGFSPSRPLKRLTMASSSFEATPSTRSG